MLSYLDYFQIASVVIVVSIVVGRALYLLARRNINPIVLGGGKSGITFAFELLASVGMVVWMTEVLLRSFHFALHIFPSPVYVRVLDSFAAQVFGVVLVVLGLILLVVAYVSFGDSWRVGVDVKTPGPLVTTGIFAVSRNPIYVFLDLWFVGIFLITGTLVFLIFAVAAILALDWQVRQEERFLLELYGQPYRDYCGRTGRYFVW
jgi:protein-S-isoprenylcysteine O-methyltransferase Ste14